MTNTLMLKGEHAVYVIPCDEQPAKEIYEKVVKDRSGICYAVWGMKWLLSLLLDIG